MWSDTPGCTLFQHSIDPSPMHPLRSVYIAPY